MYGFFSAQFANVYPQNDPVVGVFFCRHGTCFITCLYGDFHTWRYLQNGRFLIEDRKIWMQTGGSRILGNLHINSIQLPSGKLTVFYCKWPQKQLIYPFIMVIFQFANCNSLPEGVVGLLKTNICWFHDEFAPPFLAPEKIARLFWLSRRCRKFGIR